METARHWKVQLRRPGTTTQAELALALGLSRARVTQVMSVLEAPPDVMVALERAHEAGIIVTETLWRRLKKLPPGKIVERLSRAVPATPLASLPISVESRPCG